MSATQLEQQSPPTVAHRPARSSRTGYRSDSIARRARRHWLQTLSVLVTLVLWQVIAVNWMSPTTLPSLTDTVAALREYVRSGQAWTDVAASGQVLVIGYASGALAGLILGLGLGLSKTLNSALSAQLTFFYSIPKVALAPLMIVWLGIGVTSKIAVVWALTLFPIVLNTRSGVQSVDVSLLRVARSFGAGRWATVRSVVLPSSVPFIVTGLRVAVSYALIGVFVAELIAAQRGVAHSIIAAGALLQTDRVFAGVLIFGFTGVTLTSLLHVLERRLDRWRPRDAN